MTDSNKEGETTEVEEETTEVEEDDQDEGEAAEGEKTAEQKGQKGREPETPEAKRARLKRELERHEKKHGFTSDEVQTQGFDADDRYNRLVLHQEGITDKEEQDIVIDYAEHKKIDVREAAKRPGVKAEIQELRAKSTIPPTSRTGHRVNTDDPVYLTKQYRAGKYLTPEQMKKVRKHQRG